jgi:probable O-glycosylation ligase (exosortase A-associated)
VRGALVLLIVGVGLVSMFRDRLYGLLLYTWFTFFRPQEWAYSSIVEYRLSLIIGLALLASSALTGSLPNLTAPLSAGSALFLVWSVVTTPWAYDPDLAWRAIGNLAPAIVIALLSVSLVKTRRQLTLFVAVAVGSLAVHGAWRALAQLIAGGSRMMQGIGGTFNDNNAFGLALVRTVFFLIALAQTARTPRGRTVAWAFVPWTIIAIACTYSRGAFLALASGFLIFLLLQRRKLLSVVAAVLAALAFYATLPAGYTQRVSTIASYEEEGDRSALGRLHFWQVAIEMVKDRPLGVGLGNFEAAYDEYDFSNGEYGSRRAVHSTHFQALAETGWVGFVLLEAMLFWTLYVGARMRRRARGAMAASPGQRFYESYGNAIIASTIAFLVGGSFLAQVLSELNWFTFAWATMLDRMQRIELRESADDIAVQPFVTADKPLPS